eukprot:TRINITY_DN108550_c0_g1_i1.p1 TRINITY_DN108550_c0_g1~~TRINITY_DN108550_c0_g1_i1.p1  ORF type:complete len:275 (-),score=26.80 TRINITY_DN108550_c0_g1_i1:25-849(-)
MTVLPSILNSSELHQKAVYHTSSMPPRSRSISLPGESFHPSLQASTRNRPRTELLSGFRKKVSGEIRNIYVLGIISGRLVVSFQGSGRVRVFVNNEHSLELEETGRSESATFSKTLKATLSSAGGDEEESQEVVETRVPIDWVKKYSKYVINSKTLRYAEFTLPSLPAQVLVIGETMPTEGKLDPNVRPITEARSLAKVSVSGHVTSQQRFHANLGAPGRPVNHSWSGAPGNISLAAGTRCLPPPNSDLGIYRAAAGSHYQTLSTSQKTFLPTD